jgi:hypothetical protein
MTPKKQNIKTSEKERGYYLSDCDCLFCNLSRFRDNLHNTDHRIMPTNEQKFIKHRQLSHKHRNKTCDARPYFR